MEGVFKANLVDRIKRTPDIESFRFIAQEKVDFFPGQYTQLLFDHENLKNIELNKYLSFSSSPVKKYIEVTKRTSNSIFSKRLQALVPNSEVCFKHPLGNCIFKPELEKIAFLIGGIGITPVISILEYMVDKKLSTDAIVIYSNKTEEIAFRQELDGWQKLHSNIKVFYTITDCAPKDWQCLKGAIDRELIRQKIAGWPERVFFIFGPVAMVEVMYNICLELACKKTMIKKESFVGY